MLLDDMRFFCDYTIDAPCSSVTNTIMSQIGESPSQALGIELIDSAPQVVIPDEKIGLLAA